MERTFFEELNILKEKLLSMAAQVEENIEDAIRGLREKDRTLLSDVVGRDAEVDLLEVEVDRVCFSLLALQQPVARDLRFITTAMKIVKDIERVGDMSTNIAKHGLKLLDKPPIQIPPDFTDMTQAARKMLSQALDAFVNRDVELARYVLEMDDEVDNLHKKVISETIDQMVENTELIDSLTHIMSVAKFLERIGDHSANIAEMVVFMVKGEDIRHAEKLKELRREK